MTHENVGIDSDPDPRIVAVHRLIDLEDERDRSDRELEQAQKRSRMVSDELREARDTLADLLGYPSNSGMKIPNR